MGDGGEQGRVSIDDFIGPRLDLNLDESPVLFFDDAIYAVVIDQRQIYVKPLHEHLPNQIILHSFPKTSRVSKRNSHMNLYFNVIRKEELEFVNGVIM